MFNYYFRMQSQQCEPRNAVADTCRTPVILLSSIDCSILSCLTENNDLVISVLLVIIGCHYEPNNNDIRCANKSLRIK